MKESYIKQIEEDLCYRCVNWCVDMSNKRCCPMKDFLKEIFDMQYNCRSAGFINYFFRPSPKNEGKFFCIMFKPDRIKPPK
jgi:hypothetical protein